MDSGLCIHPVKLYDHYVPCGSCPNCRMKYRKQMAVRIMMEQLIEKPVHSYFLTLTYAPDFIPQVNGRNCFSKEHITTFLDSLRNKVSLRGFTLRMFLTCEYGEEGYRPHYHALIFLYNSRSEATPCIPYPRLTPGKQAPHFYFAENVVSPLWKFGFVYQGTVTPESILYCTSYALKDDEYLNQDWKGFEEGKPFRRYSLKPGLGLTDNCINWWSNYVYNDGEDLRTYFRIKTRVRPLSTGIPVGIKRRLGYYYEDVSELLKSSNIESLRQMQDLLSDNSSKFGSKMVYLPGVKFRDPSYDDSKDKEIIARRKAIRQLCKSNNKL